MSSQDMTMNLPDGPLGLILGRLDKIDSRLERVEARLDGLETRLEKVETRLDSLETRFDGLETRFDGLETRFDGLETRFTDLEQKVDARLRETRPIWEAVQNQIAELRNDIQKGFRSFESQMRQLSHDILGLRARQGDLEDRVKKLEPQTS